MPKITITITIDDGKVTVDAPEEVEAKADLEPFLMHTDEELEIEQRPMTTDEDPAAIIKANHERYVQQVADQMLPGNPAVNEMLLDKIDEANKE